MRPTSLDASTTSPDVIGPASTRPTASAADAIAVGGCAPVGRACVPRSPSLRTCPAGRSARTTTASQVGSCWRNPASARSTPAKARTKATARRWRRNHNGMTRRYVDCPIPGVELSTGRRVSPGTTRAWGEPDRNQAGLEELGFDAAGLVEAGVPADEGFDEDPESPLVAPDPCSTPHPQRCSMRRRNPTCRRHLNHPTWRRPPPARPSCLPCGNRCGRSRCP